MQNTPKTPKYISKKTFFKTSIFFTKYKFIKIGVFRLFPWPAFSGHRILVYIYIYIYMYIHGPPLSCLKLQFTIFVSMVWGMLTLFQCISGGVSWREPLQALVSIHPLYVLPFIFYILALWLAVLNVVQAVWPHCGNMEPQPQAVPNQLGCVALNVKSK